MTACEAGFAVAPCPASSNIFMVIVIALGYSPLAPLDPSTAAETRPAYGRNAPTSAEVESFDAKYSFASRRPAFAQCTTRTESLFFTTTVPGVVTGQEPLAFETSQFAPFSGRLVR